SVRVKAVGSPPCGRSPSERPSRTRCFQNRHVGLTNSSQISPSWENLFRDATVWRHFLYSAIGREACDLVTIVDSVGLNLELARHIDGGSSAVSQEPHVRVTDTDNMVKVIEAQGCNRHGRENVSRPCRPVPEQSEDKSAGARNPNRPTRTRHGPPPEK